MDRRRLAQFRQPQVRVAVVPREEHRKRFLMWASLLGLLLAAILASSAARAADDNGVQLVAPTAPIKLKAGQTAVVPIQIKIAKGWHMFGAQPLVDGVKPTSIHLDNAAGITVLPITLPPATKLRVEALKADANVYENSFQVAVKVKADAAAAAGARTLSGQLSYQACSTDRCLFPKKVSFTVPVVVVK